MVWGMNLSALGNTYMSLALSGGTESWETLLIRCRQVSDLLSYRTRLAANLSHWCKMSLKC